MAKIRLTKIFDFEAAHALYNYDGLCRNVHGHSYKLSITIIGEPNYDQNSPKYGMVMDFGLLKQLVKPNIIDKFDHSLILYNKEKTDFIKPDNKLFNRIHILDFQPTAENLVIHFANIIKDLLPHNIDLISVKLNETESSYAEWFTYDQK